MLKKQFNRLIIGLLVFEMFIGKSKFRLFFILSIIGLQLFEWILKDCAKEASPLKEAKIKKKRVYKTATRKKSKTMTMNTFVNKI